MISSARVPDITVYYRYGKTKYNDENIIIFKDYIYNVTKNVAIPKLTGSEFYFVDGINGIMVEGKDGTSIDTMLVDKAPSMGTLMSHEFNVFHDTVKEVFTDTA